MRCDAMRCDAMRDLMLCQVMAAETEGGDENTLGPTQEDADDRVRRPEHQTQSCPWFFQHVFHVTLIWQVLEFLSTIDAAVPPARVELAHF
jgi:hypothetical protein